MPDAADGGRGQAQAREEGWNAPSGREEIGGVLSLGGDSDYVA